MWPEKRFRDPRLGSTFSVTKYVDIGVFDHQRYLLNKKYLPNTEKLGD